MENLAADWDALQPHLQAIEGFDPKAVKTFQEEGLAKKGIHFFIIRYEPGEVIMAKGTTSDYAALHLEGAIRIRDSAQPTHTRGRGCWSHPLQRRLENIARSADTAPNPPINAAPVPSRRGIPGLRPLLASLYWRCPEIPIRVLDFSERWLPSRVAQTWQKHIGRVLAGKAPQVKRAERELSNPKNVKLDPAQSEGANEKVLTARDERGGLLPSERRFHGVPGTLWNQPRSVSLVADNDAGGRPCEILLIKRKALEEIIKKSPKFYTASMSGYVQTAMPDILARNLLFHERFYIEDVRDWRPFVDSLKGKHPLMNHALQRVREFLDADVRRSLYGANSKNRIDSMKGPITDALNRLLASRDLATEAVWPAAKRSEEAGRLLAQPRQRLNEVELSRLNRLFLQAIFDDAIEPTPAPFPMTRTDFLTFTHELTDLHFKKFNSVLQPERLESKGKKGSKKGVVVIKQGDAANEVFLILAGMVRVSMNLPGGNSMVNNLETDGYFGEAAILESDQAGAVPLRSANVETLCNTTLLRLDRDVMRTLLTGRYEPLARKLRRERELLTSRDVSMKAGRLLPPVDPPLEIAQRLVLTRNILLIDMDKCTRCDQCVRGCAEAHDNQPRFHRANPDLHFGKWEIAGACLHCLDSPCQQACPVGAITLLDDRAVQIHRDRCIGCSQCANECPFDVIDMYEPLSPKDAPSSKKGVVANKCDLCLTDDFDPPCVASCPYDAAYRVEPVSFFPELKGWANSADQP